MTNVDFIVAKVRGMHGKLYGGERLSDLCRLGSVEDLAAELAPGVPIGDAAALQGELVSRHVAALRGLLDHLDGWEAAMLLALLRHYQAENLKVILRCWATGAGERALRRYAVELPPPLDLPAEALMRSPDIERLVKAVPVKFLRDGAMQGVGEYEQSGRLFFIEAGIDKANYGNLKQAADRGTGESGKVTRGLVHTELDVYNVLFVLRGVFNYALLFNKLRNFLAPSGGRAGIRVLEDLREAEDAAAAVRRVPPGLRTAAEPSDSLDGLEADLWSGLYRAARRRYYTAVLSFGAVVAFAYIKRVELSNLIRISEGIRYGQRAEAIRDQLVLLTPQRVGSP
ncbi:MAG: V-type ATPase subunit [Planctomycetota bacterium]